MSETTSRKLFFVELLLFVGLFCAAAGLLFPRMWEPVLKLVFDLDAEVESEQAAMESLPALSPEKTTVRIQANRNIGEFRTSLGRTYEIDDLENQFEVRKNDAPIGWPDIDPDAPNVSVDAAEFPELPFQEDDAAPPRPKDEWKIQEMVDPVQDRKPVDAPDILPENLSNEMIGKVEPILDGMPSYVDEDEFLGSKFESLPKSSGRAGKAGKGNPPQLPTDPTWWIRDIQQPQFADRAPMPINLDNVVLMALQRAPEVQVLNTEPEVQRTLIDQNIAAFDWGTFINTAWNDTNIPVGDQLQTGTSGGRFLEQELSVEGGVTKLLATGGDIRLGQTLSRRDNNSQFLDPIDQGISRLVIDYRQPLFRGAGTRYAQRQIVLARLDFEQIQSQSIQGIQEYLVEVVSAYWQLYQARAQLVQTRRSYERAIDLLVRLQNREGIDVTNDQILRAEAAAGARKSEAIRAEYEVRNAQDLLVNLTVGPDSQETNFLELIPEPMVLPEYMPHDIETLAYVALRNRPEIGEALARIKTGETLEYIAVNELLPQLDAILSTSVNGLRGDFDAFGAFGDQFRRGDPSYSVGFEFALPVGNRAAKSAVQRQQLQTRIFTQQFEQSVGDVVLDVRIASRNLERLNSEMQNNYKALHKAAQELEYIRTRQELLLDEGKTGSFYIEDLLASQARLTEAEGRLLASQTGHAIALVDLKRATGELLNAKVNTEQYQPIPVEFVNHVQSIQPIHETLPTNMGTIPTVIESLPAQPIPASQQGSANLLPNIMPIQPKQQNKEFFAPIYVPETGTK